MWSVAGCLRFVMAFAVAPVWADPTGPCPRERNFVVAEPATVADAGNAWALRPPVTRPAPATQRPALSADERRRLIRRTTIMVTGLPPRADDVDAFAAAPVDALSDTLDRLFASPRFGEKWCAWWLDLIGYCDELSASTESGSPLPLEHAWRYRDWMVASLNRGLPFDELLALQLAGDLLITDPDSPERPAMLTATSFLAFVGRIPPPKPIGAFADEVAARQLQNVSRTLLGCDLSCARCHDHPGLPLTRVDYARFARAFLASRSFDVTDAGIAANVVPTIPARSQRRRQRQLDEIAELEKTLGSVRREAALTTVESFAPQTAEYIRAAWNSHRNEGMSLADWSRARGLYEPALSAWRRFLGLSGAEIPADHRPPWWTEWQRAVAANDGTAINAVAASAQASHVADSSSPFFEAVASDESLLTEDARKRMSHWAERIADRRRDLIPADEVHAVKSGGLAGTSFARDADPAREPASLPALFAGGHGLPLGPTAGDGRRGMAQWIQTDGRYLLARLVTNEVWREIFGSRLVADSQLWWASAPPADVGILDHFAARLIESGWSLRDLVRSVLESDAWISPRISPIRALSGGELHDALHFVAGSLDPHMAGPPVPAPDSPRRRLYHRRSAMAPSPPSTAAALDPRLARELAKRTLESPAPDARACIDWLYRRALGRPPTPDELNRDAAGHSLTSLEAAARRILESAEFRRID